MKGVLVKDLYIARGNILVTIVSLVVLGFGLSFLLETSALLVLAPVASTTAVFISITSDAASKWNKNVITMPVSRNQIIGEKFLLFIHAGKNQRQAEETGITRKINPKLGCFGVLG